ncbi:hypothetical protein AAZX31_02G259700 [Glycine max]|uniref:Uncharacterized protein n=1 Tax=Glycine max TaxID=3847 RepID=K7KB51_SOYBN|nr:uncharacterized protein LOC113000922 [Glycine max]XP_028219284.1 uncharacterized protein LOC114400838 [Glycine soja]KAG5053228.1 hypothetical protein JHK87_005426 [Glycine soja]KAG5064561.1 hypothetical protein JHK85_005744 [Glycine max]KAG5081521.1 hypothetical protein JHK86_005586 [Glycine max]KAH1062407.1 hypothetical protein GYH30_005412 [Glycine max]KHN38420.1 hypothetical protein glysoja_004085 [Glycine soja]|eukprot:XP_025983393.1 uncharacterized protein LOC113000922 [Glycine max]
MWRVLAAVTRNLQSTRKSSKVADESMFESGNGVELFGHERGRRSQHGWGLVCSILQAPISILSCVSHPQVNNNGSDGIWVTTGEFSSQVSEMNHLMVSDSMRYAILM